MVIVQALLLAEQILIGSSYIIFLLKQYNVQPAINRRRHFPTRNLPQ